MRKKVSLLVAFVFSILISLRLPSYAFATLYSGFDGVDHYKSIGRCDFGDRYGVEYVNKLSSALGSSFTESFSYEDKYAWEQDMIGSGAPANYVDFFAFAGHGVPATFLGGNGAAHLFTQKSADPPYHPSHTADAVNADWSEISWGLHGGSYNRLKWATMYCCHFLQNFGNQTYYNNLKHIFNGVHLVMGFASGMWLDSNEGTEYGTLIANGASFKEAFFTAAYHHQNGTLDEKIIARVMGAKKIRECYL